MSAFAQWQPRYAEAGIATFPVAAKRPQVRGYLKLGMTASSQLALKFPASDAFGFACRRNRLTILDIDAPDENLLADALAEFGPSPVIVRSGSGNFQAWYRHSGERRRIRPDPSRPIDILGDGFVVAPPSAGSKGSYEFVQGGLADIATLPTMIAPPLPVQSTAPVPNVEATGAVPVGRRNETLWRACMIAARNCTSFEALLAHAGQLNATQMAEPLSDAEVTQIAASAWQKQIDGTNWIGERRVIATHNEIDTIMMSAPDAFILLQLLRRHHHPAQTFVIANAMCDIMPNGGWHRIKFAAARSALVDANLLICIRPSSKANGAGVYRFAAGRREGERGEEGVSLIGVGFSTPRKHSDDWPSNGPDTIQ